VLCLFGVVLLTSASPVVRAANPEGLWGTGLELTEVVHSTLTSSPGIQLASAEVSRAEGNLLASRAAFHPSVTTTVASNDLESPQLSASGVPTRVSSESHDLAIGWSQQLRSGALLLPAVTLKRTPAGVLGLEESLDEGELNLKIVVPLRKDFGAVIKRNAERAAELDYHGESLDLQQERSLRVSQAIAAYWSYLAAQRRLEVFVRAEEFAERLVAETRLLVDGEERPASDLNQVKGNSATRQIDRLQEEGRLIEARSALGLAMGLSGESVFTLPQAGDDFPPVAPFLADEANLEALRELAYSRRADLQAEDDRKQAAELLLDAANNDLRSRLDLSTELTYSTLRTSSTALPFAPNDADGMSASFLLRHELPISNAAARGQLLRNQSDYTQQQILADDLKRRIGAGLEREARQLDREVLAAKAAAEGVQLSRLTVENERQKNRLGVATLFDVILAQDQLIAAMLKQVNARLRHAVAITQLRFETGTLLVENGEEATVDAAPLEAAPNTPAQGR